MPDQSDIELSGKSHSPESPRNQTDGLNAVLKYPLSAGKMASEEDITSWKKNVRRLVRRKLISDLSSRSEVRNAENELGVEGAIDRLISQELTVDPRLAEITTYLSDVVRKRYPEVDGVVLLGSSVHGGAKIREITGSESEPDLDWALITNRYLKPLEAIKINSYAKKFEVEIRQRFDIGSSFFLCAKNNPVQYRALELENPQQVVRLFEGEEVRDRLGNLPEHIQLLPHRQAVLYLQPSFPVEVNLKNQEILLEGLSLLHDKNPSAWARAVDNIMFTWEGSHKLKTKHFSSAGRKRDRELLSKVVEHASAKAMGVRLLETLLSTQHATQQQAA